MAQMTNAVGTHSDTLANNDFAVLTPSWLSAVTLNGVSLRYTDELAVTIYNFDGDIVWSVYDIKERKTAHYDWPHSLEQAYKLIYSIMRHDGVTNESLARLVREVRFLTT